MDLHNVDLRTIVLTIHVAAGVAALFLAGVVLAAGRHQDWTSRRGKAYVGAVCVLAVSAVALTAAGSTLPAAVRVLLAVVAALTAAAALQGQRLARRRWPSHGWRPGHLRLMWASVTSLVSALAVVSAPAAVWIVVIVVGTALTEHGYRRARQRTVPAA